MSMKEIVRTIIDDAEAAGTPLTAFLVEQLVTRDHAAELAVEGELLARRQVRSMAQQQLSNRTRVRQAQLPGLEDVPDWLTVPADDAGTHAFVPVRTATVGQFRAHIQLRHENALNCAAEVRTLRNVLRAFASAADDELLVDVATGVQP